MPTIRVRYSVETTATPEKLWDILADVDAWPQWQGTSSAKLLTPGPLKLGSTFRAELGGPTWVKTMIEIDRPNKMTWWGSFIGMKAIHGWEFQEEEGRTIAKTWEDMSGVTLLLLYLPIRIALQRYDRKWLENLKARAESS